VVEGSHSIYIEKWRTFGVVDVESTVPKSGLFYDLWDTRQDLCDFQNHKIITPVKSQNTARVHNPSQVLQE
jgi:hypothetical protein